MIERQGRRLRQFLTRKVYPYCPYYRRLFDSLRLNPDKLRRVEDLRHLPFTTKADILPTVDNPDRYRDFIIQPRPEQIRSGLTITEKVALFAKSKLHLRTIQDQVLDEYLPVMTTFTTGRSAMPTPFVYTLKDVDIMREVGRRMFFVAGLSRTHSRGLNAMPFAPHLAFWQVVHAGLAVGLLLLHSGGGKGLGTEAILRLGERTQPNFLVGTPGYIYHLSLMAAEGGFRIPTISKVILGAERVTQQYKDKLREALARIGSTNVKIFATYGFTEAKKAWMENLDGPESRFPTYPDLEYFDIIDPQSGDNVPEGHPGEIVYTHLAGAGSIVLRYRTGDRVKEGLAWGTCPATGLTLPLLGTTISRASEIKKIKETLVDLNEVFAMVQGEPGVIEWQLVIGKAQGGEFGRDTLQLNVALDPEADQPAFEERLKREFKARHEVALDEVRFLTRTELSTELGMDTLPKEARIVDRRPAG
jgi:phenylacetate-coenzyme A ligase PaaK-like adenylate-forming protein